LLERGRFASQAEAKIVCFTFIEGWYNPVRLHLPSATARPWPTNRRWRSTNGSVINQARQHSTKTGQLHWLAWSVAAELERLGSLDDAFIAANLLGAEEFMALARQWPGASGGLRLRLEESQILTFTSWLAEAEPLVLARARARTRPQWRERHQSCHRSVGAARKLGKGSGIVLGASNALSQDPGKRQRPDLVPAGTRTLNINDIGRHLVEDDIARRCARCSSTTTIRSSCTPTRTGCAAGSPVRTSSPSGSS